MVERKQDLKDELRLKKLKEIILREDRKDLARIDEILNNPEQLSERVVPIIEQQLEFFKKHFPKEYQKVVNRQIEHRLGSFKDEMVNYLYPVVGKMIRKYVTLQFQLLKEKIDSAVRTTFSFETVRRKFRSHILGINESDLLLDDVNMVQIEEIYIVQRHSGLLLGKASHQDTLDQDVVAGMLTAIKSFVEDAFKRESEDLEMIQYGSYKIFIQNFPIYYIAVAMQGAMSARESEKLSESLLSFVEEHLPKTAQNLDDVAIANISKILHKTFIHPNEQNEKKLIT